MRFARAHKYVSVESICADLALLNLEHPELNIVVHYTPHISPFKIGSVFKTIFLKDVYYYEPIPNVFNVVAVALNTEQKDLLLNYDCTTVYHV
jgi:hypothetical protein